MDILNLIQCANLGGMEKVAVTLLSGLQERGHHCALLSLNPIGSLEPLLRNVRIAFQGLAYEGESGWKTALNLRGVLRGYKADAMIMTGHHLLSSLYGLGDFCEGARLLAIHHYHTGVKPLWQWRLIYATACRRFRAVVFPCDFIRREAEAIYPPLARISHTIRNPVILSPLPSDQDKLHARTMLGLPKDVPVVGNAGRLVPTKRFDIFLRIAAQVVTKVPDALFVIAGEGQERQRLENLAQELGISTRIRWLGWQSDMTWFYQSLSVLLFNSDWDAFPTTPLEAMSYRIPVVASILHGGLKELMTSPDCGVLLETHEVGILSEHVASLCLDRAKADRVASSSRETVGKVCSQATCLHRYEQLMT